jgi:hypothetical protein
VGKICPQQSPDWTLIATQFVTAWATAQLPFNLTEAEINLKNIPQPPPDPRTTEDCLVLDVIVPKAVFERKYSGRKAPVVVWIYVSYPRNLAFYTFVEINQLIGRWVRERIQRIMGQPQ